MARYIDADALEKVFKDGVRVYLGRCDIDDVIRNIADRPTADVAEVVRCKDCRFCHYNAESGLYHCRRRGYFSEEVQENDFCSYGEREEQV